MARRNRQALVPEARPALDDLKWVVASEVGVAQRPATGAGVSDRRSYSSLLEQFKWQIADELGLDEKVRNLGWADMPTRDCGAIGGRLGGQIGGQMVRRMIALAEERLSRGGRAGLVPGPLSAGRVMYPETSRFGPARSGPF